VRHPDSLAELASIRYNSTPAPGDHGECPWSMPAADAWRAVNSGTSPTDAARHLWPYYLARVRDWLTSGEHATTRQRTEVLATAHARLHTLLTPSGTR
jgi:glucosylglycerate synthase